MDFLDSSNSKKIKYLDEERKKIWERLEGLEKYTDDLKNDIDKRTPEDEKEVRENSRKVSGYRNKIEAKLTEANQFVEQLANELESAKTIKSEINDYGNEANQQKLIVDKVKSRLDNAELEFEKKLELINSRIDSINDILEKYPNLESKLEEIDDFIIKVEENVEKSGISLTVLNKRKKDIDDMHREIFGYTQTDDNTGDETKIEGLKDELDSSYNELKEKIDKSFKNIESINTEYERKYSSFEEKYKEKYVKINDDIAKLLPAAMTAGLSSAFSNKKGDEVKSSRKLKINFNIGIFLMIVVSFIPIYISIMFLNEGLTFQEVIFKLPRVILAIIPMYIPVLWFTYSANKKLNLSKRLIEEYSHKEVLSRTYEGLSTQIESINNLEQSEELRFRLLSNFLQASSENPGKLISNYEASDHPIMEALEQSYKFQMTVDRVANIPGMTKFAAFIDKRSKNKVVQQEKVIDKSLSNINNNDDDIEC